MFQHLQYQNIYPVLIRIGTQLRNLRYADAFLIRCQPTQSRLIRSGTIAVKKIKWTMR